MSRLMQAILYSLTYVLYRCHSIDLNNDIIDPDGCGPDRGIGIPRASLATRAVIARRWFRACCVLPPRHSALGATRSQNTRPGSGVGRLFLPVCLQAKFGGCNVKYHFQACVLSAHEDASSRPSIKFSGSDSDSKIEKVKEHGHVEMPPFYASRLTLIV